MANIDPAVLSQYENQLNADPRIQALIQRYRGSRVGFAVNPAEYGIEGLPGDYVFDVRSGRLVDQQTWHDKFVMAGAGTVAGMGIGGILSGPGAAAPGAGSVNPAGVYATPAYSTAMAPVAPGAITTAATTAATNAPGAVNPAGVYTTPQYMNAMTPAAPAASKNIFGKIMDVMKNPWVGAVGEGLKGYSEGQAHNRSQQFEADLARAELQQQAERDYQRGMENRQSEGRQNAGSAFNMGQLASLIYNDQGSKGDPTNPYSRDIAAPSQSQKDIAGNTGQWALKMSADPYEGLPIPQRVGTDVNVQAPGMFEQIAGVVGPGLTTGSYLAQLRNRRTPYGTPAGTPVTS